MSSAGLDVRMGISAVKVLVTSVLRRSAQSITERCVAANPATSERSGCWDRQMRRVLPIALAVLFAAAPAAPAAPPEPWATVNVCDTLTHPNEIGMRGDMPGLARRSRMFMRFRVQYEDGSGDWHTVRDGADSGWRWVATG